MHLNGSKPVSPTRKIASGESDSDSAAVFVDNLATVPLETIETDYPLPNLCDAPEGVDC